MRLKDLKAEGIRLLDSAHIENPALEMRVILDHAGFDATRQIIDADTSVDESTTEAVLAMVEKRASHIPLAHLTGEREFYGLSFITTEDTLIPRSDTETLVEISLEAIKDKDMPTVLDLCTGTGCVGISIAANKACSLTLCDLSGKALEVARRNAERLLPKNIKMSLVESDLFSSITGRFDLIATNPPYIAHKWEADLSEEVRKEPSLALFDEDEDGLGIIRKIVSQAPSHLKEGGMLAIECDYRQSASLASILRSEGFTEVKTTKDLAGLDRVVSGKFCN